MAFDMANWTWAYSIGGGPWIPVPAKIISSDERRVQWSVDFPDIEVEDGAEVRFKYDESGPHIFYNLDTVAEAEQANA